MTTVRTRNVTQSEAAINSVDQWVAANPEAASRIPAAQIEAFKNDLLSRRNGARTSKKVETRSHIHKRQNVTQTELSNARAIVKSAQDDAGQKNSRVRASREYTLPSASSKSLEKWVDDDVLNSIPRLQLTIPSTFE